MTPEEFVKGLFLEKKKHLELYTGMNNELEVTQVSTLIKELKLSPEKTTQLKKIIDIVLTDTFYTILLGLDGSAQFGNTQELYKLYDEEGNELTGGDIEHFAWEYFHNNSESKKVSNNQI
ncbi:MAG: hypothetical protein AB8G86_20070 [Saprospiraceae bacterium]